MAAVKSFPYACDIDISFPTEEQAEMVKKVMEVDEEIGDRVIKSFCLVKGSDNTEKLVVLRVQFQATEAKMLRVAVSTFYDYMIVSLKCFQEFEDPITA